MNAYERFWNGTCRLEDVYHLLTPEAELERVKLKREERKKRNKKRKKSRREWPDFGSFYIKAEDLRPPEGETCE